MTRKRLDEHSTEFGLWLRDQKEIDSKLGFVATNLDYIWSNYKTGDYMLIEEKRYNSEVRYAQKKLFNLLDKNLKSDPKYKGLHILQFQNTSPEDGLIYWDNEIISKERLLDYLKFKL
jgi:hypothetical protein